jgi:hypothetical protein
MTFQTSPQAPQRQYDEASTTLSAALMSFEWQDGHSVGTLT